MFSVSLTCSKKFLKGRIPKKFEEYDLSFSGALFLLMYELKQPCVSFEVGVLLPGT